MRYRLKPEHIERSRPSAAELYAELAADYDLPLLDEPIPPMAGQCGVPIQTTTLGSVMRTYERGRR